MKLRLIVSALALLVLALGFNVLLSFTSLQKLYVVSTVSQYRVIAKDLQQKLERSLRFGKDIKKFVGIKQLLEETEGSILKRISPENSTDRTGRYPSIKSYLSVSVALPDGSILYSTDEKQARTKLPSQARVNFETSRDAQNPPLESYYVRLEDTYLLAQPVRDEQKKWVATVILEFGERQVKAHLKALLKTHLRKVLIILAGGMILLIIALHLFMPHRSDRQGYPKTKISLIMLLVIGSAQIVFCGLNTWAFKDHYLHINKEKTQIITRLLKEDIEYILSKGVRIEQVAKLEVLIGETIAAFPALNDVTIFDKAGHPLSRATKTGVIDLRTATDERPKLLQESISQSDPAYNVRFNFIKNGQVEGYISTNINQALLFNKVSEMVMDALTVIVISILFLVEMLILIFLVVERSTTAAHTTKTHFGVMRPAAFLFLFGVDLSISFLPLHMDKLHGSFFGLSRDVVMGLPISTEFFFVGLSILICGIWLDRRGWHEPFLSGIVLAGLGALYSCVAPDMLHFIISRAMVGLGYGLTLMACQGFVIAASDGQSKTQGLAHLFAGLYAGSICGGATGALLAERIGYRPVFFIGAVIILSVIAYIVFFMGQAIKTPQRVVAEKHHQPVRIGKVFRFLSNRVVLGLIFFCNIPAAIAVVGFLNYFSPIYLHRLGASQSTIGRVFMIYGLFLIYFGPFISKYVDTTQNKKAFIFLGCALGSLTFLIFNVMQGSAAVTMAVLLLGLSSSLIFAPQSAYILKLKVSEELGAGKAIGIFSSTNRIGQVLGPIIFSGVIVAANIHQGMFYFGLAYLLSAVLFFFFSQRDGKMVAMESKAA